MMEEQLTGDRLSALLEHSHDIIVVVDEDGTNRYVSPSVSNILGYDPDDLVGTNTFEFVHPDDREEVVDRFSRMVETDAQTTERVSHRMKHEDGSWVWVESIGSNRLNSALEGYVINSREITERRERERELREYREFNEAIFNSLEDGFFVNDTNADVRRWNQAVTEISGYTDEEVASMNAAEFIHPDHHERVFRYLVETLETGSSRYEADLVTKDGTRIPFEFVSTLLEDPDGEPVITGIGRNITERKERIRQLQVLDRVLRHNFNNDMTVVRGYADTILQETSDEDVAADATAIIDRSDKLLQTVAKEREIVEIVTGRPELQVKDPGVICERVAATAGESHPDADIEIDIPADPVLVETEDLPRAIEELVENAIIHNDRRTPSVTITVEAGDEMVRITIADDGPGIPDEEAGVLLGDRDIEPLYHGSGLGLWLVHWIVHRSDGTLTFEKTDHRGSRVTIGLPIVSE
ncbi:MAG: PAS domain S-box protein [Natronomonas sp.]